MSIYRWAKLDDQSGPDRSIELIRYNTPRVRVALAASDGAIVNQQASLRFDLAVCFAEGLIELRTPDIWVEQFQNPRSIAGRHQCAMPEKRPLGRILRRADRRENDKQPCFSSRHA